jgi:hypothetical protein
MPIEITSQGDYKSTREYLKSVDSKKIFSDIEHYAHLGLAALQSSTPVDTGLAQHSWGFQITSDSAGPGISWYNDDIEGGLSVVILIQYGHGTGTGGYVQGRDFINPAMRPVFDFISTELGKKVSGG